MLYLWGMKIISILRELNWGLQSFNDAINKLGLSLKFRPNSKISDEDYEFLKKLFFVLKKEETLCKELNVVRNEINTLCLRDNQDPHNMGELEKRQLFNLLRKKPLESILMPNVDEYTVDNFWIIYNWNVEWNKKNTFEKRKIFDAFVCSLLDNNNLTDSQKEAISRFINYVESGRLSKPSSGNYHELINWYHRWISLTEEEKEYEEDLAVQELEDLVGSHNQGQSYSNNDSIDDETAIMSALIHGSGDKFGFD